MTIKLSEIVNNAKVYHYLLLSSNKKVKLLISSNNVKKGKIFTIKKIRNLESNNIIIRIKLKRVTKKQYKLHKKSPLKLLGGPLYAQVIEYDVIKSKKKFFFKRRKPKLKNKVYFPKKYLFKKMNNKSYSWLFKDIKKIALAYTNNKLNNSLLAVNKINKL